MRYAVVGLALALLLGMLAAAPSTDAQSPGRVFRIGTLFPGPHPPSSDWKQPLVQGLRELGWVEGQNVAVEDRWAEGKTLRLPELAADLVRAKVDVILTASWPAAVAAKQAATTIPVVITGAGDPVGTGLVASLARPGGNITELGDLSTELSAKRLELLKETAGKVSRVAVLWNSTDGGMNLRFRQIQIAAGTLGLTVRPLGVQEPQDFDQAFTAMTQERPDALFVIADPLVTGNRRRIVEFAAQHRLPAMYEFKVYADDGGLMAYGPSQSEMLRRGAAYVARFSRAPSLPTCPSSSRPSSN